METGRVTLTLFTDGACLNNPGPGGWAALIEGAHESTVLSGGCANTTNNRMELLAVIKGLESLNTQAKVSIFSDSKYVIDGVTKYLPRWRANGWKRSQRKPVKNLELWQQLDALIAKHRTSWHWVLAHSGIPQNEFVDTLAREEALRFQSENS